MADYKTTLWATQQDLYLTKIGPRGGQRHILVGPATTQTRDELIQQLNELKLKEPAEWRP